MEDRPAGAGKSSFGLIDVRTIFSTVNLQPDTTFLDLACGSGQYALEAAETITEDGAIYAVDLWQEGIAALRSEAEARGIEQIHPKVADIGKRIPVGDGAIDVCLIAAALHDLVRERIHDAALREVTRVLKPAGRLAVVEFKKISGPPGPPLGVRLSPEEADALLRPHGFDVVRSVETGPYHYVSLFLLDHSTGR